MQKIRDFLKTDFYFFMKYYLYYIIFFSICFYILLYINNNTNNNLIIVESKVFFYVIIFFLFIIINDILETPLESLQKFFIIIVISTIIVYVVNYLIVRYYKGDNTFTSKLFITLATTLSVYIISVLIIYFMFERNHKNIAKDLYNSFNFGINKNFSFLIFLIIYLFIYKFMFSMFDWNSNLGDIICPSVLGVLLIFFIFCFIIYVCLKLKLINRIQILNSFIVLASLFTFLALMCAHIFMSSLGTICTTNETQSSSNEQELVSLLILASIFIILWLDDTRNWHQKGSIIFIIVTLFTLYCMFYYSTKYPSTGLLSFWLFVEWLIIIFYKKENSKNSLHFSFMST